MIKKYLYKKSLILQLVIFFIFIWTSVPVIALELSAKLTKNTNKIKLVGFTELFEDKTGKLGIQSIQNPDVLSRFKNCNDVSCYIWYKKGVYWTKISIFNKSNPNENWVLEINSERVGKSVDLYEEGINGTYTIRKFDSRKAENDTDRTYSKIAFSLLIKTGQLKTIYLRIENRNHLDIDPILWSYSAFNQKVSNENIFLGCIMGILAILMIYNFTLSFSFKDNSYLYYVLLITVFGFVILMQHSLYMIFFPSIGIFAEKVNIWLMVIFSISWILFARSFVRPQNSLAVFNLLSYLFIFVLISSVLLFLWTDNLFWVKVRGTSCALASLFILIMGAFSYRKGYKSALFFILAMCPIIILATLPIFVSFSLISNKFLMEYGLDIGFVITFSLFSLILAYRVNTTRLEKEKAQKETIEVYKKTEKIKDEFLANTSHELRTPIHGIIGIADSLLDGIAGNLSSNVKENLQLVVHSGKRLSNLVNDILDYSRLKNKDLEIKKESVNIKQVVDIVIQVCHSLANKNVVIKNQIPNDIPAVVGDEDRLQQIMFNLLGNAIKFTKKGQILVSAKFVNNKIAVMVSDTGEGMPLEKLNSVFEEFEQVDSSASRKFGGTGIGLSITKKLIELHGGTISVTSVVGQGSQFTFFLPLSNEKVKREEIDIISSKITSLQLEPVPETSIIEDMIYYKGEEDAFCVLVVDDDAINRTVTSNYLALYNYEVQVASSGKEALQFIENNPKPNIILLDLMMPDMTGFEVTGKIREQYSLESLPIIIVTAVNRVKDFVMALQSGANDYITKPFNNDELITRIKLHRQLYQINLALKDQQENLENQVDLRTAEIRKLMENIEESRDIAIAANNAKSEFLANMSHELRTPMHGLLGFAKLGRTKFNNKDIDKLGNYLDEIVASGERLLALLNDLLDLSKHVAKKVQYEFKEAQLIEIVKLIETESVILMSEKEIDFRYGNLPELDYVYIDYLRMGQVVRNLFSNAIKFSSPKGKIMVDIFNEKEDIVFTLTDNGIGIPEDELESIFDEFVQSSYSITGATGTGLGLSICKRIIAAHSGHIWAESNPDGGAIMKFRIPLCQENEELTA